MSRIPKLHRSSAAPPAVKAKGVIHKMVAETAKGIAETVYEDMAHDDHFYKMWPSVQGFVRTRWTSFIQIARETLAEMLGMPESQVSAHMKAEIHEALLLNAGANPAYNAVDDVIEGRVH